MFFLFITAICAIVAVILLLVGKVETEFGDKINLRKWALIPLGLALFCFAFASVYRLDPGEASVERSFTKKVVGSDYSADGGMQTKAPWVTVEKFNVRNQQINFLPRSKDDENVADDVPITASTKDNATVTIDVTITYNQAPDKVLDIYNIYRTEDRMREQLIRTSRSVLQDAPTHFATLELRPQRAKLQAEYLNDLSTGLRRFGITVTSVDVRGISFSKGVQTSLDKVQERNAQVEQARARLEQSKIQAEVIKTEAKAQSDADQIARCGATITDETQVINGKKTAVKVVTPVPSDQCQSRLNEQVLTSKYIDMLSKKGNTVFVVPPGVNNLLQLPATK